MSFHYQLHHPTRKVNGFPECLPAEAGIPASHARHPVVGASVDRVGEAMAQLVEEPSA